MTPITIIKLSLAALHVSASCRVGSQNIPRCGCYASYGNGHGGNGHGAFVSTNSGNVRSHPNHVLNPPNNFPLKKTRKPIQAPFRRQHFSSPSDSIISKGDDIRSSASEKARQLRERAKELRLEAISAEQSLLNNMQQKRDAKRRDADKCIDLLLGVTNSSVISGEERDVNSGGDASTTPAHVLPAAQTLAIRINENNLGIEKLMNVVERLHERETFMIMGPEGYLSRQESAEGGGFVLGDYENNSIEYKQEEVERLSGLLDRILEAVTLLDQEIVSTSQTENVPSEWGSKLRVRVADLRKRRDALVQRRVNVLVNTVQTGKPSNDGSVEEFAKSTVGGEGDSLDKCDRENQISGEKVMKRLIETPAWLPTSLAAFAATSPVDVSLTHWKMIKSDLLADSEFVCTSWDSTDVAAVFRGRLSRAARGDESSKESITTIFDNLQTRLGDHAELSDRIQLFLIDDNEWLPSSSRNEVGPPPVIIALAKNVVPEQEAERSLATKSVAAVSAMLTAFTTIAYALSSWALNPTFFNSIVNENDATALPLCLPIFIGVLALSALHEAGHIITAKKHGVKLGLPVPLPSLQVGTFGSITPLRSFPPTRAALFDVAIGGPAVSMIGSLILIIFGLSLTVTSQSIGSFPMVPAAMMKSSVLIGFIVSIVSPLLLLAPLSQPVPIHPFFLIGLGGLVLSAVNMLPIGRLDGGRACLAVFGRRIASAVSFLSLLVLAIYSFTSLSGIAVFWGAIVILSKQRFLEIPCIDEVTNVGGNRLYIYILMLILALLTLSPYPGGIGPI
jgi:Zn-dependent protease